MTSRAVLHACFLVGTSGLLACSSDEPKPAEQVSQPAIEPATRPAHPASALVGAWHGEAMTTGYGLVTADISITRDGGLIYTVIGQGLSRTGVVTIEAWTGIGLRVRDGTTTYDFIVRKQGDSMTVALPVVGDVTFARQPKSGGH